MSTSDLLDLVPAEDKFIVATLIEALETLSNVGERRGFKVYSDLDAGIIGLRLSNGKFLIWNPTVSDKLI